MYSTTDFRKGLKIDIVEHQAALVNIHRRFPYDERDSPHTDP